MKGYNRKNSSLKEAKCPICNKVFVPAPEHMYKAHDKVRYVCTYHCMLESEKRFEARRAMNMENRRKRAEERKLAKEGWVCQSSMPKTCAAHTTLRGLTRIRSIGIKYDVRAWETAMPSFLCSKQRNRKRTIGNNSATA